MGSLCISERDPFLSAANFSFILSDRAFNSLRCLLFADVIFDHITAYYNFCNKLIAPGPDRSTEFAARTVSNYLKNKKYMEENLPDVADLAENCLTNLEDFYNEKHANDATEE